MEFEEAFFKADNITDEEQGGILYLCPTPIGNLEDITYRTWRILQKVDYIAAEDMRHTKKLLNHFEIHGKLISYHEHNREEQGEYIIRLLEEGHSVALVSDAGMPAISDPGAHLVGKAIATSHRIVPLPGANAALTALMASGLDTTEFTFFGFLPKRKNHRLEELQRISSYGGTLIFYEAPHRIEEVLGDMYDVLGNRSLVIARELTKKFETFMRCSLEDVVKDRVDITIKGEFVILLGALEGSDGIETGHLSIVDELSPVEEVFRLIEGGLTKKEAIRQVAIRRNMARRDVYNEVECELEKGQYHV